MDVCRRQSKKLPFSIDNPHASLGLKDKIGGGSIITLWRPGAQQVFVEVKGEIVEAYRSADEGLFAYQSEESLGCYDYRIYHNDGILRHDPYSISDAALGDIDLHLFSKGHHYRLYEVLGARVKKLAGFDGVSFSVWAPSAVAVSVVGDFNGWDGLVNPMQRMGVSGVWQLFVPGIGIGVRYKFQIQTQNGALTLKADPMALAAELRPANASIVADVDAYLWNDRAWMEGRKTKGEDAPMVIYEVHLGSWKRESGTFLHYRRLAHDLADYCVEMGFTHVELLPLAEHPLDESWGYQLTGPFAVTARYGSVEDFQYFVDHMHSKNIGVIIDWVAGHFPRDSFGLACFDGSSLFEHEDPRQGLHPHWDTHIFNFGRYEVSGYLISSALFWLDKMHVDGLRVDAVASMLYLDYGRENGEWIPNAKGGRENLEAIEFLKHLNSIVHTLFPSALMIAEESTAFFGVTHPLDNGGLGFDLKWNMGWMNDTLRYFSLDPLYRKHHHQLLTFGMLYTYCEKHVLVLSHDEVVHGKGSLLSKMPGDRWQKFAQARLCYSYMMCQVGKKLIFMGCEIGQWSEWRCNAELDWHLLAYAEHRGMQKMVQNLNHLYKRLPQLWREDFCFSGFSWVDFSDVDNSVVSYLRCCESSSILCVHNFTPSYFSSYFVCCDAGVQAKEIFNSDSIEFAGSGKVNQGILTLESYQGRRGFFIQLAPLATMMFTLQR